MVQKRLRTVQPAHKSDRITVEQATEVWRRIRAENEASRKAPATGPAERSGRRTRPARGGT